MTRRSAPRKVLFALPFVSVALFTAGFAPSRDLSVAPRMEQISLATATPAAGASVTVSSTPTPAPSATSVTAPSNLQNLGPSTVDPSFSSSLQDDESSLLQSSIPTLSTSLPLSDLPTVNGSVASLSQKVITLLSRVEASSLSASRKATLVNQLENVASGLVPALAQQDQIATLRGDANTLLQSEADAQAAISGLSAQIQLNLNKLRVDVQAAVSANVVASVQSLSVTVSGGADTIQANLGAKVNRLLVNVVLDLDVLHIATLHATANVDTSRLTVTLSALVRKLTLDLGLLLTNLQVGVKADASAGISAEASLTVSLAAEVDGVKADLATNVDTKIGGLDALLTGLIGNLNGVLASTTTTLHQIQSQIPQS